MAFSAGNMSDVAAPDWMAAFLRRFFKPNLYNEGMRTEFNQIRFKVFSKMIGSQCALASISSPSYL